MRARAYARAFSARWDWICGWSFLGAFSSREECQTPIPIIRSCSVMTKTQERLKIELFDLPFPGARSYRVRVNGEWARKLPLASKTMVAKQLRGWLVKH